MLYDIVTNNTAYTNPIIYFFLKIFDKGILLIETNSAIKPGIS